MRVIEKDFKLTCRLLMCNLWMLSKKMLIKIVIWWKKILNPLYFSNVEVLDYRNFNNFKEIEIVANIIIVTVGYKKALYLRIIYNFI